ncbi:hypothetical protein VA249_38310 [Vibrio alfacsensis]|uniref:hypothetical protein n=1 Tax=Vibrio alfacsensis TaxID=1074311 RepID=UPI001BEE6CA6|nr:hypothetical protein [Vibrio alfacsensis]WQE78686.1 hypothetical protein SO574_16195 [Vibrio alfacsensis]BBM67185.1 hypothetical protein VA249_38310 [Vibrio alfacsensis]
MDKYQAAYAKRLEKLKSKQSPKNVARISAWDAFFNKEYDIQDLESQMADSVHQRYEQSNVKNEISFGAFKRAFYNESIKIYDLTDGASIQKVFTPLLALTTMWVLFVCFTQ